MLTLKDFMELVNYRITEGSEYGWKCFGYNAHTLDSWDGRYEDGYNLSITFDTKTQVVYSVEVCDYQNSRAYRMINPDFVAAHSAERIQRGVDYKEAWDKVDYVDLDVVADFTEKARAIIAGESYDTRVQIELELDNELMLFAYQQAHEQDITLNQYFVNLLRNFIDAQSK